MSETSPDLSLAERVDVVCDQFEREFRAGSRPAIKAALAAAPAAVHPALFRALLELDIELRQRAGEVPHAADYEPTFPAAIETIHSVFEALQNTQSQASSVKITGIETSQGPKSKVQASGGSSLRSPSDQLGRFEIKSILGEGAFGTVYRARDPQLDRDVAVKVPRFAARQSPDDRERFLREARAAAGLHHAHICPVHEVGIADGRDYIVLAFIDGKPLSRILQTRPKLSDRQIVAVIRKLALALQEAHDQGIIHRDLKPANIMINRKGEPVIMDFGLARRANSGDAQISHSGQIMGTPAYMSPEQARGDGKGVGPASDIYSLGIVFYELLCGRRPFEGTVTEVIGQILHVDPPPPMQFRPEVDERLQALCLKAIAKRPADRFASMKDFAAALVDYAREIPRSDHAAGPPVVDSSKDASTHQFADLLAAISSDVESKVERAVQRADRPHRLRWWTYLAGSALMGLVVLLGILFFARKDTVTVIVNIPGIDTKDPSLTFLLDGKPVPAETFAAPVELKPGEHELVVNQDGKLFKRFVFKISVTESGPVVPHDVTPTPGPPAPAKPVPAKPVQPPPAALPTLQPSPLDVLNAAEIPDGKLIKLYGSREQAPRELVAILPNIGTDPRDSYMSMALTRDGKLLATSLYPWNLIELRNLASRTKYLELATERKQGWVHFVWLKFSADGRTLYGQRLDEDLYAYDVRGQELWRTRSRKNYCQPALAPDDQTVIVAEPNLDSKALRVLDARTGAERTKWDGLLEGAVYRLEFSPDGKTLAVMTGRTLKIVDPQDGSINQSIALPMGASEPRFGHDGKTVFHPHFWKEPEEYVAETNLKTGQTREYRLSPHGCRIVIPNPVFPVIVTADKQQKIHFWDTDIGPQQKPYVIPLGSDAQKCEFTPEGRYLVAAANAGIFIFRLPVDHKVADWGKQTPKPESTPEHPQ